MLQGPKNELSDRLRATIRSLYGIEHDPGVEIPPRRELGDLASPAALHLARELKRKPRDIAEEIAAAIDAPAWVRETRIEGPGFLNVFFDRSRVTAQALTARLHLEGPGVEKKVIVEHTNINPNKAAHIGHLRNAILGDVLARVMRAVGTQVEVQNYIDDTGVQVADVVVGLLDMRQLDVSAIAEIPEPFDHYCWDLYSAVAPWYEEDEARLELRRDTLHQLEARQGSRWEVGRLVAERVLRRHLDTMRRIDVEYDLITHESDILGLHFFDRAFEQLKAHAAVRLEAAGKNVGCWIMPLSESEEFSGLEEPDKVIVRSDGTVTYVGKDIAYQLWKFGLLERDFFYRRWPEENVWQTAMEGEPDHPAFGGADRVVNVIDARQAYLQKIVRAGLEALGHTEEAERSIHFAYEMVSLSTATARELGFAGGVEGSGRIEMSGRKGIGVKADDLLKLLEEKSYEEIGKRNRELDPDTHARVAQEIVIGAIRFFMAKATTTRVIAFDLEEALSFEGDSGPYLQYSLVRARNICRRLEDAGMTATIGAETVQALPAEVWEDDLWNLVLTVARTPQRISAAAESLELSLLARHALDLAQQFNAIYHRHPILQEPDGDRRNARLATVQVFARGMETVCALLGVPVPQRM